jgi:ABC-type Fe3+ transport system permease subunit
MVKYNLERQVQTLEKFIRLYLIAGTIILPLLIIGLWFILYHRLSGLRESFHFLPNAGTSFFKSGLAGLILLLLFTVVLYYVNKWYIHKLYGRHIAKLRAVLREMEEAF